MVAKHTPLSSDAPPHCQQPPSQNAVHQHPHCHSTTTPPRTHFLSSLSPCIPSPSTAAGISHLFLLLHLLDPHLPSPLVMSRVCLLLVLLSVLLGSALGGTFTYTLYSDNNCQTVLTSGSQSTFYQSLNGISGYSTSCFRISGVPGASYAGGACANVPLQGTTVYAGALITYSDSGCTKQVGSWGDIPPGTCGPANTPSTGSVNVNCNGADHLTSLSLPLLAVLSIILSVSMAM